MKRNARTLLMDTTPMTVGVDSPSRALIKKKNNLQNNLTLQHKQGLVGNNELTQLDDRSIVTAKPFVNYYVSLKKFSQLYSPLSSFFGRRTEQTEHSN